METPIFRGCRDPRIDILSMRLNFVIKAQTENRGVTIIAQAITGKLLNGRARNDFGVLVFLKQQLQRNFTSTRSASHSVKPQSILLSVYRN